ncbi:MAG: hypothetical protein AB7P00_26380, partial [Sandaracinaceae bacterium]
RRPSTVPAMVAEQLDRRPFVYVDVHEYVHVHVHVHEDVHDTLTSPSPLFPVEQPVTVDIIRRPRPSPFIRDRHPSTVTRRPSPRWWSSS